MSGPGGAAKGNPSYEVMGVTRHWRFTEAKMEQLIAEARVLQIRIGCISISGDMVAEADETRERLDNGVLLVIVGAGASYDCLPDDQLRHSDTQTERLVRRPATAVRPPLTKDLVERGAFSNELVVRYPQCRPVVDELRRRLRQPSTDGLDSAEALPVLQSWASLTLEQALHDYEQQAVNDPAVHSHITAFRFYLRDLLWASTDYMLSADITGGVTNSTSLVRELRRWAMSMNRHVCIVSFNYDLLLDQACHDHWGLNPFNLDTYVSDPYTTLMKPHGSVQWAWHLPNQPQDVEPRIAPLHAITAGRPAIPEGSCHQSDWLAATSRVDDSHIGDDSRAGAAHAR